MANLCPMLSALALPSATAYRKFELAQTGRSGSLKRDD